MPSIRDDVRIELLADHPAAVPVVKAWLESEWPGYFGPGMPGPMRGYPEGFARRDRLPCGVLALRAGTPCGLAVLKTDSLPTHQGLTPWVTSLFVAAEHRRRGIAGKLVAALEERARAFGFPRLFCATAAGGLLLKRGWIERERLAGESPSLGVYEKAL